MKETKIISIKEELKKFGSTDSSIKRLEKIINNENDFPIELFPLTIQAWINELNEKAEYNKDVFSCGILCALSIATGKTHRTYVKSTWKVYPSLYLLIVGISGGGKSHPLIYGKKPLCEIDDALQLIYNKKLKEYKDYCKLSAEDKMHREEIEMPVQQMLLGGTTTREANNRTLKENPRGTGAFVNEVKDWFNKLITPNGRDDKQYYIDIWDNTDIKDRTKKDGILKINEPYQTIFGGIQPNIVKSIFTGDNLDSGFIARFLFCTPKNLGLQSFNLKEASNDIYNDYEAFIKHFYSANAQLDELGVCTPTDVKYSSEGLNYYKEWHENMKIASNNKSDDFITFYGKLISYFHKFSLLFQLMYDYSDNKKTDKINLENCARAGKLVAYFLNNILSFYNDEKENKVYKYLNNDVKISWYNNLQNEFKRDVAYADAKELNLSNIDRLLCQEILFKKVKYGFYSKSITTKL